MEYRRLTLAALVILIGCNGREAELVGAGGGGGTPEASTGVGGTGGSSSTGTGGSSSTDTGGSSSTDTGGGSSTGTGDNPSVSTGTGGSSGGTSGCAVTEDCFNGVDDDCDDAVDCADSDCTEGSLCVKAPRNVEVGVVVDENEQCPEGFTASETLIYRGLSGGGCEGCSCTPNPTECLADLYLYSARGECEADTGQTGGYHAKEIGLVCDGQPINGGFPQWYGVRAGTFEVIQSCTPSGTAIPAPATWATSKKFCRATRTGAGCSAGEVCVARQAPQVQCTLVSGSATCDGYGRREADWFQGYLDTRTCSSCACTATGGNCNNVDVYLGHDYDCNTNAARIKQGERFCGYAYAPPAYLVGTPTPSTCTSRTNLSGSLDPTGQSTLCCVE